MILLVDNYDSFSYNLFQLVGEIDPDIKVVRNDELTVSDALELRPSHIILSPGPGRPKDAGIVEELALAAEGRVPVLGVCLGHQGICEAYGGRITYARRLMHGKSDLVTVADDELFAGLGKTIKAARYHSLVADEATLPKVLKVTARSGDGEIMAMRHVSAPTFGVQFHPESILTEGGRTILRNFLATKGETL